MHACYTCAADEINPGRDTRISKEHDHENTGRCTQRAILHDGGRRTASDLEPRWWDDAGAVHVRCRYHAPVHSHPHEQIGYVVSGEIDLIMEGHETARLTAGGSYYVAPNVRHGIITYAPSELIDCFTPMREDFL